MRLGKSLILISMRHLFIVKNFCVFNFRCLGYQRKFFNSEFFPIYGILNCSTAIIVLLAGMLIHTQYYCVALYVLSHRQFTGDQGSYCIAQNIIALLVHLEGNTLANSECIPLH